MRRERLAIFRREDEHESIVSVAAPVFGRGDNRSMRFFAEADKQTNQSVAAYTPTGWGSTLLKALSECVQAIHRFPYEGPLPDEKKPVS